MPCTTSSGKCRTFLTVSPPILVLLAFVGSTIAAIVTCNPLSATPGVIVIIYGFDQWRRATIWESEPDERDVIVSMPPPNPLVGIVRGIRAFTEGQKPKGVA